MNLLDYIIAYKEIIMLVVLVVTLILILLFIKPKKVKPIEKTIDDTLSEKTDIEKVIDALESSKESRPMTSFEEEQEANAIISYQELVQAVKEKKALMEVSEKTTQPLENNVSSIVEAIEKKNPSVIVETIEKKNPSDLVIEEPTSKEIVKPKFKSSEFISPIFGKAKNNDEFLKELKDFRSNL